MPRADITFVVARDEDAGGFSARWDDPDGGGIATQGDTLPELHDMVRDAVLGYFEVKGTPAPAEVRLHFTSDPVVELAVS